MILMGLDITASKAIKIDTMDGLITVDEITSFTFSSRLNDYWGARQFFLDNVDRTFDLDGNISDKKNADSTFIFTKNTLTKMKEKNDEINYGEDVTVFLDDCLGSGADKVYVTMS